MNEPNYNLKDSCPTCSREKSVQATYCRACWWVKARRKTLRLKNIKKYQYDDNNSSEFSVID